MADQVDTQAPPVAVSASASTAGARAEASHGGPSHIPSAPPRAFLKTKAGRIANVLALVAVAAGIALWLHYAAWESTDDAQIDSYLYPVSARISGYISKVNVDDNQEVKAGETLVEIDPRDYQVALASAEAALANDQAAAGASRVNVPITTVSTSSQLATAQADFQTARAGVAEVESQLVAARATQRQAEANDAKAQDDVKRFQPLVGKDEISQQQFEQAVDTQQATAAAVEAAKAFVAASEQLVNQARAHVAQAEAEVQAAETRPEQIAMVKAHAEAAEAAAKKSQAALDQARLNLEYTRISAPVGGVVGQRSAQVGKNVVPGQQMMVVVPLEEIWVTANFKETQLRKMRPGQPARIYVDTYGREYAGHVDSIAGASGARFSLFPPENATGNFVKVVQRIPVKIILEKGQDPQHLLRPGMSVDARVKVE